MESIAESQEIPIVQPVKNKKRKSSAKSLVRKNTWDLYIARYKKIVSDIAQVLTWARKFLHTAKIFRLDVLVIWPWLGLGQAYLKIF